MNKIREYDSKKKKAHNNKYSPQKEKEGMNSDKKLNRKRERKKIKDISKDKKDNEEYDEDAPELDVKEIKSYKINQEDYAIHGYLLEEDKSFLIHGFYYFLIYDSNTFEVLQEKNLKKIE